jgi:hypothetical protein
MDTNKMDSLKNEAIDSIINFLEASIPLFDELFEILEKNNGWFPLDDQAIISLSELNPPWYTLYENKEDLFRQSNKLYCGNVVIDETSTNSFLEYATKAVKQSDENIKPFVPETEKTSNRQDTIPTHKKKQESIQQSIVTLAQFINLLAFMIHRRSMCQLIVDAKDGDDNALCLAVQIDRTVLQIPYFQKRLLKAQFSNDASFLDKLAYRIKTPVLQSKIKYRTLLLTFAILDDMRILDDFKPTELFKICKKIGVIGKDSILDDVDKFNKQLIEYKKIAMK